MNIGIYEFLVLFILFFFLPAVIVSGIRKKKQVPLSPVWKYLSWVIIILGGFIQLLVGVSSNKGSSSALVLFIIIWVISLSLFVLLQLFIPSKNQTKTNDSVKQEDNLDSLIKYKELLDKGIISKEEFEQKKAAILKNDSQL